MNRVTLSILVLFILAGSIYVPSWFEDEEQISKSIVEEVWQPNYVATNMRSSIYDANGNLNSRVFAKGMEHYDLLGFTLLDAPKYNVYIEGQSAPWQMTAGEGTLYENNRVQLEKQVTISNVSEDGFLRTIATDYIEMNLSDKSLQSDQPVTIMGANFVVSSNGVEANLESKTYELRNHVQTEFSPH